MFALGATLLGESLFAGLFGWMAFSSYAFFPAVCHEFVAQSLQSARMSYVEIP